MEIAPDTPLLQPLDEEMGDDTLAGKLQQAVGAQSAPGPLQAGPSAAALDPSAALQQHLESCHATLNSAHRQNMEEAQQHIQQ
eukprot:865536-Prorocentrum_lima.AAC.1